MTNPFADDQLTDREILRNLWTGYGELKEGFDRMGARLTSLEKFKWLVMGGLAVISLVIAPMFVDVMIRGS